MIPRILLIILALLISSPVWASIQFSSSGEIRFGISGSITLSGTTTPTPSPSSGWLNATMTSNTEPSPNVVSSSEGTATVWHGFDHDLNSNAYLGMSISGDWIKFDFGSGNSEICNKIYIKNMELFGVENWTLAGSNNDSSWTDIGTGAAADNETLQGFTIINTTSYRYYRLTVDSAYGAGMGTYIFELELWNE